jgi:hypothetical protein
MVFRAPAWVLMVAAYFQAVNSSLIIFGFAALENVLLDSGVYAGLCVAPVDKPCTEQIEAVNFLFVVNASVTLVAGLLVNGMFQTSAAIGPESHSLFRRMDNGPVWNQNCSIGC